MTIVRRGYEPKDGVEFGPRALEKLRRAGAELKFLLDRGYEVKSASTFIGNHHQLSERQRLALARTVSPKTSLAARREKELADPPEMVTVDGFNTIITLEVALSGSLLLEGMDGTIRDLAGLRGSYRIVDKTHLAASLLMKGLAGLGVKRAVFYLDQQVSNSGRLRDVLLEAAEGLLEAQAELYPDVDRRLYPLENVVTADAIILDECVSWFNLNRRLILENIPGAWLVRLWEAGD